MTPTATLGDLGSDSAVLAFRLIQASRRTLRYLTLRGVESAEPATFGAFLNPIATSLASLDYSFTLSGLHALGPVLLRLTGLESLTLPVAAFSHARAGVDRPRQPPAGRGWCWERLHAQLG